MNSELIKFSDVTIGYGKKPIIEGISFSINENDFLGIVGPNGSGKTTLLKTLLGNLKPIKGDIVKDKIQFGYVPQRDVVQPLLPYSVYDVVMMGRYSLMGILGKPQKYDVDIVNECLKHVGIEELRNQSYNSLSGGQRQRTLIARALAVQPQILILDEPTNGMDTPSHYSLLDLITQLHDESKLTVIIVSHLLTDVANIINRLMLLEKNHFQVGNIEEILSEDNLKKTYSSDFTVAKINNEYLISSRRKN
ncbi:MAG: metal ABC transporter ATP-binding protein [Ignavibacteriaceae bacterium]|nr:metal ABC transporter ATP-binding protein [Ignavibacteriaceae bacterium]